MIENFQSDFVFGLQGKQYQNFVKNIAMPIIEDVIGTDNYELINFEHHLSFMDFKDAKNPISNHIYINFLNDITKHKENIKVSFKIKVCITLDEQLCQDICPKTNRKITTIRVGHVPLAYFIYFNIREFFDFIYS